MNSSKVIGGYFGLEVPNNGSLFHDDAIALNSGRSGLGLIIRSGNYERLWVPYYTCDVLIKTIQNTGIEYRQYSIDNSMLPLIDNFREGDAVLYTNYFGVYSGSVEKVRQQYANVIIDNCQAFYNLPLPQSPTFYSPRKFFGVPDGGFVYGKVKIPDNMEFDKSHNRCGHLLKRVDVTPEYGFEEYKRNDKELEGEGIKRMSHLTGDILRGVDYSLAKQARVQNFTKLDSYLGNINEIIFDRKEMEAPLCYPFLHDNGAALKKYLIQNRVFIPTYWPGVKALVEMESLEYKLTNNLVCLPIDQRYGDDEMEKIIELIQNFGIC